MAQGSQKIPGSEGPASISDAASVSADSVESARPDPNLPPSDRTDGDRKDADSPPRLTTLAKTRAPAFGPEGENEEPNGTVILDEANDLLVISEAGTLLHSTEGGWADAVVAGPVELSEATASWAKEVLATETESDKGKSEESSLLSKDCFERGDGEDASLQTVDWIDW